MAGRSTTIGSHTFDTKDAAKEYIRALLARYPDDAVITGDDAVFLQDLLGLHHEADRKIGVGIHHFSARRDTQWGTSRHFVVCRVDGTDTDFSFHKCLDGRNERRDVFQALRHAVADQINACRGQAFAGGAVPRCPYTGQQLSPASAHIDHTPPNTFLSLVMRWLQERGLRIADVPIDDGGDNTCVRQLTDSNQERSWQEFHRQHARLRVISGTANLSHVKLELRKL